MRCKVLFALEKRVKSFYKDCATVEDMEIAVLAKQIDIFISYRRQTGNQMASLIKVLLTLRGYKVFIDVDRLAAGQFDMNLLKNIQAAKHFLLILSEGALDPWAASEDPSDDWMLKEVKSHRIS